MADGAVLTRLIADLDTPAKRKALAVLIGALTAETRESRDMRVGDNLNTLVNTLTLYLNDAVTPMNAPLSGPFLMRVDAG